MKQRITIEQLNELTEEQKVNLREWWKPQFGDVLNSIKCGEVVFVYADGQDRLNFDSDGYEWDIKKNCLPLISAGQMIEILNDKTKEQAIGYNDSGCFWHVRFGGKGTGSMLEGFGEKFSSDDIEGGCLVEALWQAVKAVL